MQRFVLGLGLVAVISTLVLALLEPDIAVRLLAAVCVLGGAVALIVAMLQTLLWISRRSAR